MTKSLQFNTLFILLANLSILEIVYSVQHWWIFIKNLSSLYRLFIASYKINYIYWSKSLLLSSALSIKFKKTKWKYKKNIIKRCKLLKKIKKILIHRKLKKTSVFFSQNISFFSKKLTIEMKSSLTDRIPLTSRVIQNSYLDFFYKFSKEDTDIEYNLNTFSTLKSFEKSTDESLTIFLRNYDDKPYWKLRLSRILHWKFFFKKKSIRKQRYSSFLPFFLKKQKEFTNLYIYLLTIFTNMQMSWTRIQTITLFIKKILIIKVSPSIFFLPTSFSNVINWKFLKTKTFKNKKKISRWSYLNFKRWQFPWLQKKKNFPKIIKHITPTLSCLKSLTHFDPITGYLLFFSKIYNYQLSIGDSFKINFLVKLHMYRYKSN